jgi:hypothetical protein
VKTFGGDEQEIVNTLSVKLFKERRKNEECLKVWS